MRQGITHTLKRYSTAITHRVAVLPIIILMPHSACNCRCIMCDIWKGNRNLRQLSEPDVSGVIESLKKLQTKRVVMSGGEALLNPLFFRFCELLRDAGMKITVLSTGITLKRHATELIDKTDEVIVSLDGDEILHDEIRNIKGAFSSLAEGVKAIKTLRRGYPVSARTVIHRLNFRKWTDIVNAAQQLGLDRISFLAADVTSDAFNRPEPWEKERQQGVLVAREELNDLQLTINGLFAEKKHEFETGFIAETPAKLQKIYQYYAAHHGLADFPGKKCNAPWVSAVIEADGSVRPCFFHDIMGNVRASPLHEILNAGTAVKYRKELDIRTNSTCQKCVCYLYLRPRESNF